MQVECDMGDWFVLFQISKNVDFYYFNQFMHHLIAEEIIDNKINEIKERTSDGSIQIPKIKVIQNGSEDWEDFW